MRCYIIVVRVSTIIRTTIPSHTANNHSNETNNDKALIAAGSAQALLNFIQAGIVAHQSGKIKDGIPYIIAGLNGLAALFAKAPDQQRVYKDLVNDLSKKNDVELDQLFARARRAC